MADSTALLLLFVVLPFVAAAAVIAFVSWRAPGVPEGMRTSDLLRHGTPARAELVGWQDKSVSFVDRRPMVAFHLRVAPGGGEPFELVVTQSVHRSFLGELREGMAVEVRLSPDRTAGAIDWEAAG